MKTTQDILTRVTSFSVWNQTKARDFLLHAAPKGESLSSSILLPGIFWGTKPESTNNHDTELVQEDIDPPLAEVDAAVGTWNQTRTNWRGRR